MLVIYFSHKENETISKRKIDQNSCLNSCGAHAPKVYHAQCQKAQIVRPMSDFAAPCARRYNYPHGARVLPRPVRDAPRIHCHARVCSIRQNGGWRWGRHGSGNGMDRPMDRSINGRIDFHCGFIYLLILSLINDPSAKVKEWPRNGRKP